MYSVASSVVSTFNTPFTLGKYVRCSIFDLLS